MNEASYNAYKDFLGSVVLNLGSTKNHEAPRNGTQFVNLDMNPAVHPDVLHDLRNLPLPIEDNSFDCVIGSHVFEHIAKEGFLPLAAELHRILKPGGHLLSFTPYGSSFDAWENPHHLQCFTETTWFFVMDELYENPNTAGYGADQGQPTRKWELCHITMVPYPEFLNDPEIEWKRKHLSNVIQELHVVLKAVK